MFRSIIPSAEMLLADRLWLLSATVEYHPAASRKIISRKRSKWHFSAH